MPNYAQVLARHLADYKSTRLGLKEDGAFVYRGKEVLHGHIIPVTQPKWLNILEPVRADVQKYLAGRPEVVLHQFFHHLNSSQAFALNLFFPFFEGVASPSLIRALGLNGGMKKWYPEHVGDATERTNVDIAWQDENNSWTYCEVKLSEAGFGRAKADDRHFDKLAKVYAPTLIPHCEAQLLEPKYFFANYQILRNVWLAARDTSSSVLFLLPIQNKVLWEPLLAVKSLLKPLLAERVHVVGIENVLHTLLADKSLDAQLAHYTELLIEKYLPV